MTRAPHSPPLEFETLDDVVEAVRREGGRLSIPRRLVLEALFGADAPVSAESIAGQLGLELTSVYRNLEHLEALGVVRHVHLGHGPGLYALRGRGAREYLVCELCDGVTSLEPTHLDDVRSLIRETFDFEAGFGHFPILGLCADCRSKGATLSDIHAHEHTHEDGTTHTHAHELHEHDHTEHEHEHEHEDGTTHAHPHVHEDGVEDDHTHDH
jgi:Fur family ferric uptake transcriptional regulator